MSGVNVSPAVRRVRFPRLERGGWMWGLDGIQFWVVMSAVFSVMLVMVIAGAPVALRWCVIALPVAIFGATSWGGRTLISRTRVLGEHMLRKMRGATTWSASEKPIPAGTLALPGKVGARITVHATVWAHGGLIYDAGTQRASVVLRCEAVGWPMADDDDRDGRAEAFADLCKSLIRRPHIERVAIQARTAPATRTAAVRWNAETVADREAVDAWGQDVMHDVLDGDLFVDAEGQLRGPESQVVPVRRDCLVVISMSVKKSAKVIKSSGGGLTGTAKVLATEVRAFGEELKRCGVTSVEWLTPAQIGDAVRIALDPDATDVLDQAALSRDEDVFDHGRALLVDDSNPSFLSTSGGMHATFWIGQWPQTEVAAGFLDTLIAEGSYPHCVTTVLTAEPPGIGLAAIERRRMALESKKDFNQRLKRPTSILDQRAEADLAEREEELANGHVNVRCVGYLRVSGRTEEDLELHLQMMHRDASRLDLQLLRRQQWEAFCASSLPLGWGL